MSDRFSIDNMLGKVSLSQFKNTAESLESALKSVRPGITSELLLTTDGYYYDTFGSLTIIIPEIMEEPDRREGCQLDDLNKELWKRSFETELYIRDSSTNEPYMVCLTTEAREPNKMFFYCQGLDKESQEIFYQFRQAGFLQRIGKGYPKPSNFAASWALASLCGRQYSLL